MEFKQKVLSIPGIIGFIFIDFITLLGNMSATEFVVDVLVIR